MIELIAPELDWFQVCPVLVKHTTPTSPYFHALNGKNCSGSRYLLAKKGDRKRRLGRGAAASEKV